MDSIVFDLDGTLWDTCPACAIAWNNVLSRNRISFRPITAEDIRAVTGKPHEECIRRVFEGLSEDQIQLLIIQTQAEDNLVISQQGGILYSGVESGLRQMSEHYPLFIVSNCQAGYIETFLKWTGFTPLFRDFECWGNTGRPKPENLKDLIKRNGLKSPIFVGDAEGDEKAAAACEIPFVFANYGFGKSTTNDAVVSSFEELTNLILGGGIKV
jgi:phosphoglycolate phosphatase